jgi:hypothetical protein
MKKLALCALGLALTISACSGGNAPAAKATAAPPAATTAQAPAASAAGDIGVPECDDYIAKYSACLDSKVPEAGRAALRQAFDQTKAAWKQAATTQAAKDALAMGCKQALEASKAAVAAYGCSL